MTRFVPHLVREGVAHPVALPDLVAAAASGMAVRFAPLIAASPADRPLIKRHLVRLYLPTLGIEPAPSAEEMP
jgi:hypothetical protein